ncbi:hypothetical protein [Arthrobacter sp. H14-L1]|uniref:hypothetical protein n=1 Tax=Arthrobacter sp. H14-L1 TaxID=2996697 RepID=UPI0022703BA1|nr:hypothetical protein [Arthrobacter sp. H14-L1]MCY0904715.1 hypothetical protein [Arthrobacter sp. H14-L1]
MSKTKVWVGLICLLLVLYLVIMVQRAFLLLADPNLTSKGLGAAYLVLPLVGAWALVRELLFGARMERLAKILEAEGGLPVDDLPRTPGGRIVRAAADAEFAKYQLEAEAAPENWRSWFRLSCAYDASGDRTRARKTMRAAITMFRAAPAAADR